MTASVATFVSVLRTVTVTPGIDGPLRVLDGAGDGGACFLRAGRRGQDEREQQDVEADRTREESTATEHFVPPW